ncbi:tyrosinase central domain-containing protein [Phlyctema vagabunda]|uniref:Tyrosinase central domain-containing protein n=1 Tax=Phlyctema vagabunda TaxID=108571 RepID=A0ABR4PG57_9HELO
MRFQLHATAVLATAAGTLADAYSNSSSNSSPYLPALTTKTDALAALGLKNLASFEHDKSLNSTCTLETAVVRKEWSTLSNPERVEYTDAVNCLMKLPSRLDPAVVPGAKNRYDDFVAIHINQTLTIHGTANFLTWHRYFVWVYEEALRNECGYTGYQPYWNWGKYAFDPVNSPIFDGSAYSMGGNGEFEEHGCTEALPTLINCIPPGQGGGCVTTGPFANMSVNLGPISPTLDEPEVTPVAGFFDYNPRCLKRDVSVWVSSQWTTDDNSTSLLTENPDIYWFQTVMQGDFSTGFYGVHTGGHFTIGGDPGGDIFASPGDPAFWLHHGQIDRTYWIWQNQDLEARQNAVSGTITLNNNPPSRNGTLEDIIDLNVLADPITIGDAMSTLSGPFCYIYA